MKKTMSVAAMIAFLFVTSMGMANDLKMRANNQEKSLVFQMEATSQPTSIRMIDADSHIIYSEKTIPGNELIKKINLSKLPLGIYTVEVEDALRQISYTVVLKASEITITDRKEDTKPVFRKKGDRVFVNLLNLDLDTVEIVVYDSTGRRLFSESSEGMQLVQKTFNFENAYSDNYTVMVRDQEGTYYEEVSVK